MLKRKLFSSYQSQLTIILISLLLLAVVASNLLVYSFTVRAQFESLRERLENVVATGSLLLDAEALSKIPLNQQGVQTEEFKSTLAVLRKIRKVSPDITWIYTLV